MFATPNKQLIGKLFTGNWQIPPCCLASFSYAMRCSVFVGSKTRSSPSTLWVLMSAGWVGVVVAFSVLLDATGSVDDGVSFEVAESMDKVVFAVAGSVDGCELIIMLLKVWIGYLTRSICSIHTCKSNLYKMG
jgi:hypothetical protein